MKTYFLVITQLNTNTISFNYEKEFLKEGSSLIDIALLGTGGSMPMPDRFYLHFY